MGIERAKELVDTAASALAMPEQLTLAECLSVLEQLALQPGLTASPRASPSRACCCCGAKTRPEDVLLTSRTATMS